MTDWKDNPENDLNDMDHDKAQLDQLLSGYTARLDVLSSDVSVLEEQSASMPDFPTDDMFSQMWDNISAALDEPDVSDDRFHDVTLFDEPFLSAYCDNEIPLDDPLRIAYEEQMPLLPDTQIQLGKFQDLSSLIKQYAYRFEASCTIDVTAQVMANYQLAPVSASGSNQPVSIRSVKDSTNVVILGSSIPSWFAIPLTAAAAVLLIVLTGGHYFNPGANHLAGVQDASDTSQEARPSEEIAQLPAGSSAQSESLENTALLLNQPIDARSVLKRSKNPISERDWFNEHTLLSNALEAAEEEPESEITSVSELEKLEKNKIVAQDNTGSAPLMPYQLAAAVPKSEYVPTSGSLAQGQDFQLVSSDANEYYVETGAASVYGVDSATSARLQGYYSNTKRGDDIPTAEEYVLNYCDNSGVIDASNSTEFMQTCIHGL